MLKYCLPFIFIFILSFVNGQTITVYGTVKNSEGEQLAQSKIIYGEAKDAFTITNQDGKYSFRADVDKLKSIKYTDVRHESKTISVNAKLIRKVKDGKLELNVVLNDNVLKEVVIQSKKPDTLFGTQLYSVADFEIDKNDRIILLTYPKSLKKGSAIKLLDENRKVVDTYIINERAIEIKTDYRKNVHLITKNNVYYVHIDDEKIFLLKEDRYHYFKFVAPILDTLGDNIYYSNFSEVYPAFNYFQFNQKDSIYTNLIEIIDEPLMEQYRAEFKFSDVRTKLWAHNKQLQTGIDKEVWVGASVFSNSIYYEPLYAPLFVNKDSILVFDHYKNKLFTYTNSLLEVDSVKINYHQKARASGWQQPLLQDKQKGNVYAMYLKNGYTYLSQINLYTGKIIFSRRLYYRYIEKIKIANNKIYYIYRPYESIQKKYIYVETLNV